MRLPFVLKLLSLATLTSLLSGCLLLNDVNPYKNGQTLKPDAGRSLIVFGVGVENDNTTTYPKISINFEEYDVTRHKITGNCWRYNNITAVTDAKSGKVQYFVFDVAPGFYSYDGNYPEKTQNQKALAFLAPAGRIVYFGDFIRTGKHKFEMRRNSQLAASELKSVYPKFNGTLVNADTIQVEPPRKFLCTP